MDLFTGQLREDSPSPRPHIRGMNIAPLENLRGDYHGMSPDWTVPQHADLYSAEDQAVWRLLVERQTALARRYACDEFLDGLASKSGMVSPMPSESRRSMRD